MKAGGVNRLKTKEKVLEKVKSLSLWLLVASIIIGFLLELYYIKKGFTIDDSFISFRYAEHFANGSGIVWNEGTNNPVEGYSNFLWIIIMSISYKIGLDIVTFARVVGGFFGLSTLILSYFLAKIITKDKIIAGITALGVSIIPAFSAWSVSGMGTAFYSFIFILSFILLIKERQKHNLPVISSVLFAIFALTRIEGVVIFIAVLFANLYFNMKDMDIKSSLSHFVVQATSFGILYIPYFIWRWTFYGYLFPNTVYVKAASFHLVHPFTFIAYLFPLILIAILGVIYAKKLIRRDDYYLVLSVGLFWWFLSFFISPIATLPIRFHVPILPILSLSLAIGIVHTFKRISNKKCKFISILIFILIILNPVTLSGVYGKFIAGEGYTGPKKMELMLFEGGLIRGAIGGSPVYTIEDIVEGSRVETLQYAFIPIGKWIYEQSNGNATIAIGEAGAIPYYSKAKHIDLGGLNDEYIAHNGFDINYLLAKQPDYIILASTSKTEFIGIVGYDIDIYANDEFNETYNLVKIEGVLPKVTRSAPWILWIYERHGEQTNSKITKD